MMIVMTESYPLNNKRKEKGSQSLKNMPLLDCRATANNQQPAPTRLIWPFGSLEPEIMLRKNFGFQRAV